MDLDEKIKSKEEGEIGSERKEKGDLLSCSSPLHATVYKNGEHNKVQNDGSVLLVDNRLTNYHSDPKRTGKLTSWVWHP